VTTTLPAQETSGFRDNGLAAINGKCDVVVIHDAVRPLLLKN